MSTNSHSGAKSGTKLVSTKDYVEINGVKHGLIRETIDDSLPVLLVVHGGPGFPLYPIAKAKNVEFYKYFTVCYYDQRGTGMSYVSDGSLNIEQVVSDSIEISKYIINKFDVDKLYLLGHSWGTIVASLAAKVEPHLFHAYIGIGQVGTPQESERETFNYVLAKAKEVGNKKWITEIEGYPFDDQYYKNQKYNTIRSKYTEKFGAGFLRDGYSNFESLKDILRTPLYTLKERINILRGAFYSYQALGETMANPT
ncbi:alpha/beta fold hydrolase [Alkalicoccobacillus murimartini]|uniref:Pimeloyl-ACP methyl ester carboxylesterase n=1 Tax=Alkalicoccobacillus murimartini TaxID=171685 RepID=A0ABT9YN87_9BACI|nr:alpha/beta fold hydrolase [Alkalicoccobacillus murimartini]MDQ0209053.1 pimeloyl-ACP methyl ester carboxylesterase [Alkalicoccobacillus murimartini]